MTAFSFSSIVNYAEVCSILSSRFWWANILTALFSIVLNGFAILIMGDDGKIRYSPVELSINCCVVCSILRMLRVFTLSFHSLSFDFSTPISLHILYYTWREWSMFSVRWMRRWDVLPLIDGKRKSSELSRIGFSSLLKKGNFLSFSLSWEENVCFPLFTFESFICSNNSRHFLSVSFVLPHRKMSRMIMVLEVVSSFPRISWDNVCYFSSAW